LGFDTTERAYNSLGLISNASVHADVTIDECLGKGKARYV
jgi:hypothetical protein